MKKKHDYSELVLLNEYNSDAEAYIAKGVLETNGIPCIINNEIMSSVYPLTLTSLGGIRVMVFEHDLATAKALLGL